MTRWKDRAACNLVALAALTAVVASASPAAAADPLPKSSTTVQASPSAAEIGQWVTLTAKVTCAGDPSGGLGMTFWDGGDILDTVPVTADGAASQGQAVHRRHTHDHSRLQRQRRLQRFARRDDGSDLGGADSGRDLLAPPALVPAVGRAAPGILLVRPSLAVVVEAHRNHVS